MSNDRLSTSAPSIVPSVVTFSKKTYIFSDELVLNEVYYCFYRLFQLSRIQQIISALDVMLFLKHIQITWLISCIKRIFVKKHDLLH